LNKVRKGRLQEKKIADYLKYLDFDVYLTTRTKFHNNDFFGLFDIIAIKEGIIYFIQVKSGNSSKARKDIEEFINKNKLFLNNKLKFFVYELVKAYDFVEYAFCNDLREKWLSQNVNVKIKLR